jgi:hypothetical protein
MWNVVLTVVPVGAKFDGEDTRDVEKADQLYFGFGIWNACRISIIRPERKYHENGQDVGGRIMLK